jgi:hypothetical protein
MTKSFCRLVTKSTMKIHFFMMSNFRMLERNVQWRFQHVVKYVPSFINVHPLHGIHFKTFLVFTLQKNTFFCFPFFQVVCAFSCYCKFTIKFVKCSSYSRFRIYYNGELFFSSYCSRFLRIYLKYTWNMLKICHYFIAYF